MTLPNLRLTAVFLALSAFILTACMPETHYLERDVRDDVFYFVMPDRFENGDLTNDTGGLTGDRMTHGFDPYDKAWYHGGDMVGLESKLDYLKDMGITAIWMTPILKNKAVQGSDDGEGGGYSAAYHGYWTLDFTQIDPHLGSNEDLKSLIDAAHERNMKVFFDIITNHTADVIKYEECHDEAGEHLDQDNPTCPYKSLAQVADGDTYTPFVPAGEEDSKVPAWLNDVQYYNNQGDSTFSGENSIYGDFSGLDDIDTRQPEVVEGMVEIFKDIVTEFKPDGFRIDTVKHVNIEFWQEFSPQLLAHAHAEGIPNFFMFGEVYDGNPQYLSTFTTIGKLPSVLDFGIQGAASSVFSYNGGTTALADLFAQDDVYSDADSDASYLMNFGGNHDMGRLGYFIQSGNPDASDEELLARAKLFNAFMFFARGIPVIYYGDEQGFTGDGGDQDARENMFPSLVDVYNDNVLIGTTATTAEDNFDQEHPLYLAIADYSILYQSYETLRTGVQVNRYSEDGGLYAFSRLGEDNVEYLVVFNADTEARSLTLESSAPKYFSLTSHEKLDGTTGEVTVDIEPMSFAIYQASRAARTSPKSEFDITGAEEFAAVSGRVDLELALAEELAAIPTYIATFEVSMDGGNSFDFVAKDVTAPYRLFWQSGDLPDGTDVIVRATLDNGKGKTTTDELNLIIDSRVPATVSVDYENGNDREFLFVSDHNGGVQGPIAADTGVFTFGWDDTDNSQLLVFADKDGDVFTLDKPVQITRSEIVALSTENSEGGLDAFIYVNNSGDASETDNDVGGVPVTLPTDPAAEPPLGDDVNLRGGLNSWGTDLMAYVGNQTYKVSRAVGFGDVEFKFADSNWATVNIGGQVGETGLVLGSNPGNLVHHFAEDGYYDFYLLTAELEGETYYLHFIDKQIGPAGETLYLKGDMNGWSNDTPLTFIGDNTYLAEVPLFPGSYGFKLANEDWSWERTVADGVVELDVEEALATSGGNSVLNVEFEAEYTFTYLYDASLTVTTDYVSPEEPALTVVFNKPADWADDVNIYFWEAQTTDTPAWPGLPMENLGDGWYRFVFNNGTTSANVIFNDGANQTSDLFREGDGCYVDDAWQDSCPPYLLGDDVDTLSLRFEAPEGWTEAAVYYWNTSPVVAEVAWPGELMTLMEKDGWFEFEMPEGVSAANLIFNNNNNGEQTADLYRDSDGCYLFASNEWLDECVVSMTVYVETPSDWAETMNTYYWNAVVPGPAWPGEAMTNLGSNWFSFDFPDGVFSANLIFNDGTNQTTDLVREGDGCYSVATETWSDSCALP